MDMKGCKGEYRCSTVGWVIPPSKIKVLPFLALLKNTLYIY